MPRFFVRTVSSITILWVNFLFSCAISPESFAGRGVELPRDDGTLVYCSFLHARATGDIYARSLLFEQIAREWHRQGNEEAVRALQAYWLDDVSYNGPVADRFQLTLAVARSALLNRQRETGITLLQQLYRDLGTSKDPQERSERLAAFIRLCLQFPAESEAVLKPAMQALYILEDPWSKAYLLTEFADFYQGQGRRRAFNLLQQAIPAATGITNPFQKTEACLRIARGMEAEGYTDEARRMVVMAYETITEQEVLSIGESDARSLAQILPEFVRLGYVQEAQGLVSLIPSLEMRLPCYEALAAHYYRSAQNLPARLMVQRLVSTAGADVATAPRMFAHLGNLVRLNSSLAIGDAEWLAALLVQQLDRQGMDSLADPVLLDLAGKLQSADRTELANRCLAAIRDTSDAARACLQRYDRSSQSRDLESCRELSRRAVYGQEKLLVDLVLRDFLAGAPVDAAKAIINRPDAHSRAESLLELLALSDAEIRRSLSFGQLRFKIRSSMGL